AGDKPCAPAAAGDRRRAAAAGIHAGSARAGSARRAARFAAAEATTSSGRAGEAARADAWHAARAPAARGRRAARRPWRSSLSRPARPRNQLSDGGGECRLRRALSCDCKGIRRRGATPVTLRFSAPNGWLGAATKPQDPSRWLKERVMNRTTLAILI